MSGHTVKCKQRYLLPSPLPHRRTAVSVCYYTRSARDYYNNNNNNNNNRWTGLTNQARKAIENQKKSRNCKWTTTRYPRDTGERVSDVTRTHMASRRPTVPGSPWPRPIRGVRETPRRGAIRGACTQHDHDSHRRAPRPARGWNTGGATAAISLSSVTGKMSRRPTI